MKEFFDIKTFEEQDTFKTSFHVQDNNSTDEDWSIDDTSNFSQFNITHYPKSVALFVIRIYRNNDK
ncbi:2528_t:CDS:2 [Cetraspora pellucida]|uniref:2528_t:CDS:1 n=1 Tax=Cetraspora pellucida TaxID=1433469 RepID=A0ACA9LHN5_9GLOM|nr:2528_t:CDS:2 [Cetraspora pellucida]